MEANITELWQVVESMQLELDSMSTDMDTLWLMLGAILVIFMQAGFAMLEVGSVGAKHTKNLLVKNLLDLCVAAVMWWSFGWGIAFGVESASGFNQFVGPGAFFARGDEFQNETGNYGTTQGYSLALWLFQWSFSGAAVTIVSGAVGERICLSGYFFFSQFMVGFIYPVVVRWGWNANGWASPWSDTRNDLLFGCGAIDFAGSGVVHTTGGIAALVLAVQLGPRWNRFNDDGTSRKIERQSVTMQTLGAFILWVGWYGFNGCSTLYITGSSHTAAKAMVCTTVSASAAGLGVASSSLILYQHVEPDQVINGILSGLVAITASCAVVEIEGAFVIGMVAALNYLLLSKLLEMVRIDDMVDASPVHLTNGVWGVIAAGLFASEEGYSASYYAERSQRCCGFLYGCGTSQLKANAIFILVILCWSGVTTFLIGYFAKFVGILRISVEVERRGTDSVAHGGADLPEFANAILAKLEILAEKTGQTMNLQESSNTFSPRSRGANCPGMTRNGVIG